MKKQVLLALVFLFCFCSSYLFSQREANIWYFGSHAGLDFNSGSPVPLTDGAISTTEGCASIASSAGNLLFYTDGITVWNKLHLAMPNGTGLLGDPSATQSGIIVPKPGSGSVYYVFTVAATGGSAGLRYSEVDMSLAGGLGDVTSIKNIPLTTPVTEKLTAVKHANNVDIWVISHNYTTNAFYVYLVTAAGVSTTPLITSAGSVDGSSGIGYLKASADGSKLVQALRFSGTVDVLSFNNASGAIALDFTYLPSTFPYGAEFSPDGSRLYVGLPASTSFSEIRQFDMTLGSPAAILASNQVIGALPVYAGALQIGPDNKIYIAKYMTGNLARIDNPNALGAACNFAPSAVSLAGMQSLLGLPNFIQTYFQSSSITYVNTCLNDTTFFSLTDSITVDSIHWNFGDPGSGVNNTSAVYAPGHVYPAAGTYTVTVNTYLGSALQTSTATVTITAGPQVSLGSDTSFCAGSPVALTLNAGSANTYSWQDGSTSQTFNATAFGTYYVNATNSCGTTTDTIHITASPAPVVIFNDITICAGQTASLSASGAGTYSWSAGAVPTGTGTATAGPLVTTTYTVTGSFGGCSSTDAATVIVHSLPVPAFTASVTSGCAPLCVQFNETGSASCTSLSYSFGDGATSTNSAPVNCYETAGIYSVAISCTDANGCTGTTSVANMISVFNTPLAAYTMAPSGVVEAGSTITFSNSSVGAAAVEWSFGDPASGPGNTSFLSFPTHTYPEAGEYCITLIAAAAGGCSDTVSDCISVISDITIPNVFTPNGDGLNELFVIKNLEPGVAVLKVYNRWGGLIYESSAYKNDWNGKNVSDGVYYYILDYPPAGKVYTGFVQVIAK